MGSGAPGVGDEHDRSPLAVGVRASSLFPHRTFGFSYEGQRISITYTQATATPQFLRSIRELNYMEEVVELLATTIVAWDVLDDDDKPWPTTTEGLSRLGFHFLNEVAKAIGEDALGKGVSSNGSSPADSTVPVPSGTHASGEPAT